MLRELRVENLLLIERAELRPSEGLNVLTGETGAGKTVLAHALDLLLGGRARQNIVRPGAAEAYVEGSFELTEPLRERLGEQLSPDAQELVLARRVSADGRTRAYVNGRSAPVAQLRDIGGSLLSFYGQHEHRRLTLAQAQLGILDACAGPAQAERLRACAAAHALAGSLHERLTELQGLAGQRERELDLLDFELGEIDAAEPDPERHAARLAERERLRRLDALQAAAGVAAEALAPDAPDASGAASLAAAAAASLAQMAGVDARLDALASRLAGLQIEAQDLAAELRSYCENSFEGDAEGLGLEQLEERIAATERLMRKHGGSVEMVLEHAAEARRRREELTGAEVAISEVEERLAAARSELGEQVKALRAARRKAAAPFAKAVGDALRSLAMDQATFEVSITEREPGPSGADGVEFMLAPNPGVPPGPLREIASGGELSRVMLAIMSVADADAVDATIVFDEVDAGIGGQTARAVGARLRELAARGQVLCITHLPQIASLASRHFAIVKDTSAEPTRTSVVELASSEVESELVRMLGAEEGDRGALRHARELRRAA